VSLANAINKLSDRRIRTLGKPGRHSDGGGLYVIVDKNGAKRWAFLFRKDAAWLAGAVLSAAAGRSTAKGPP
jgi:hypothetical protein